MTMTTKDHLRAFMARRKWAALESQYGVTTYTMLRCIRDKCRPSVLTPGQWEDVLVYREEWHKANNELRSMQ